jgi:hypothetical protein
MQDCLKPEAAEWTFVTPNADNKFEIAKYADPGTL